MAEIRRFWTSRAWIEGKAVDQLEAAARFDGVSKVAAFPDLHPGKNGPVGIALLSEKIYPLLVGNDIGCGMALFKLGLPKRKLKAAKAAAKLRELEGPCDDLIIELEDIDHIPDFHRGSLGTIGGGNHFCEVQTVEDVFSEGYFDPDFTYLLVHSGSRSFGAEIFDSLPPGSVDGYSASSGQAEWYLSAHDKAVRWASLNRQLIAARAAKALGTDSELITDVPHNLVERYENGFLHRKGAARAVSGIVPVAGSRAGLSYAVVPAEGIGEALHTVSHGAGRKHDRASMHGRVGKTRSDREALSRNQWGGQIVCEDRNLLLEEAPEAYKDARHVVEDLQELGLTEAVASFVPQVTFKRAMTADDDLKAKAKSRDIQRRSERRAR